MSEQAQSYPEVILISEAYNTYGCHYSIPGNAKIYYGFNALPPKQSLWLECVSGDAVNQILGRGLGEVTSTRPGAYGGQCRTISVNVSELEEVCSRYWKRVNRAYGREMERMVYCYYCGGDPVVSTDFFGSPVCQQCSR